MNLLATEGVSLAQVGKSEDWNIQRYVEQSRQRSNMISYRLPRIALVLFPDYLFGDGEVGVVSILA